MRTSLNKALVDAPDALYSNVAVHLESDDDVTLTATVTNRQGVTLRVLQGAWRFDAGTWHLTLADDTGQATITRQPGCGCGGSTIDHKHATTNLTAGHYDPQPATH